MRFFIVSFFYKSLFYIKSIKDSILYQRVLDWWLSCLSVQNLEYNLMESESFCMQGQCFDGQEFVGLKIVFIGILCYGDGSIIVKVWDIGYLNKFITSVKIYLRNDQVFIFIFSNI